MRLVAGKTVPAICFEPQDGARAILSANTQGFNVICINDCALSDSSGEMELYVNSLSSTSSLKAPNETAPWIAFKKRILGGQLVKEVRRIPVRRLDEVMTDARYCGLEFGNALLKIDVEGAEHNVLKGASDLLSSGRIKLVQIERARWDIYENNAESPESILKAHGFRKDRSFLFPLQNFYDDVYVRA